MGLTNFPNGVSSMGMPIVPGGIPTGGKVFFVDYVNGSDAYAGTDTRKPLKTISAAYTKCTAGKNDIVYLLGNGATNGSHRLTTALTWAKNATHLIGVAAPTRVAGRARIAWLSTATKTATLFTLSASGCIISNVHMFQDYATAERQTCLAITGERNYLRNCHIAGMGNTTGMNHADASSMTLTGDGENTFEDCTFGLDTTTSAGAVANCNVEFLSAAVRNHFINCTFLRQGGNAANLFLKADASGDLDRFTLFDNCKFINGVASTATTMTAAASVHASAGGMLVIKDCMLIGCTDWNAADTTNIWIAGAGQNPSSNLNTGIAHTIDVA